MLPEAVRVDARRAVTEAHDALALTEPEVARAVGALERFKAAAGKVANSTTLSNFLAMLSLVAAVAALVM